MAKEIKSIIFTVFLFIVFVLMALEANTFSDKAKFFPFFVAIVASILCFISVILQTIDVLKKKGTLSKSENKDELKGLFKYLGWVVGYIAGIYVIGFIFATILFLLLFLKLEAKLKVVGTLLSTSIVIGVLLLLEYAMNLYWPLGILFS